MTPGEERVAAASCDGMLAKMDRIRADIRDCIASLDRSIATGEATIRCLRARDAGT